MMGAAGSDFDNYISALVDIRIDCLLEGRELLTKAFSREFPDVA